MKTQVRVMRSYDYNHFEIALECDCEDMGAADELRKQAARLVDKAVEQFKVAQRKLSYLPDFKVKEEAMKIIGDIPESEWTPEQKAAVKKHKDQLFYSSLDYDYEDDLEEQ